MNEELQKALVELLKVATTAAEGGLSSVPWLVKEWLRYRLATGLTELLVSAPLSVLAFRFGAKWMGTAIDAKEADQKRAGRGLVDETVFYKGGFRGLAGLGVGFLTAGASIYNLVHVIGIIVAPHGYLVDHLVRLGAR